MKFTKIKSTAFDEIQLNAGVLMSSFNPETPSMTNANIIGCTTGGINFTDTPSFVDFGDDIDNAPKNTKELKRIDGREVKMSGTYVTVTAALVGSLAGAADVASDKITPRDELKSSDFTDIWWVGDYSSKNSDSTGGFIAVHLKNAMNTGGFQIQTSDKAKGNFSFEYTAHYSLSDVDDVPYEVYVHAGTE